MAIIEINNLYKSYGKKQILKDLSLKAYEGEVLGLLGPNGAGKTTLIKSIVGLISYDEGTILINGHDREKEFIQAMQNVSAIVENPEMYGYMSGYSNLCQYARMHGLTDKSRIDEVINIVGLSNRIKEKVKTYSLGMKQRLGIALALLNRPKVMILDEPTNGLDPAGIKQLRNILRNIAKNDNVCIIVSSHLMSEMELMCDKVAIVDNKTIKTVNTISELKAMVRGNYSIYTYNVESTDAIEEIVAEVFADYKMKTTESTDVPEENTTNESLPPYKLTIKDKTHFEIEVLREIALFKISDLNRAIFEHNIRLFTVAFTENMRLEDAFIKVTTGGGQIA